MLTMIQKNNSITAISGIRVGHATNLDAATGCTVILCPPNTVGGVDQRGGSPGTRETDLLRPMQQVQHINAILLSGGSAYGLAAADGVMRYLEEHKIGFSVGENILVPIVPSAIIFDLAIGRHDIRPDAAMGYHACERATTEPVLSGTLGAGTGARVGAMFGNALASKGGIGSAAKYLGGGLIVAALAVVNAIGDVYEETGEILAGLRSPTNPNTFKGVLNIMEELTQQAPNGENTVIGVVITNAKLNKEQTNKIAQMAHDGLARAVRPAHTMYDGDTIFALATGEVEADVNLVGAFAAEVFAQAIRDGVRSATTLAGVRAWNDSANEP